MRPATSCSLASRSFRAPLKRYVDRLQHLTLTASSDATRLRSAGSDIPILISSSECATPQITGHLQRLNKLEADLKSLSSNSALKSDYEKNRVDMKKIVDGLHDEVLDIKKRVLGTSRRSLPV
ncbi:hypothetical protein BCV70DRAFT_199017 [Testicularia cyperi]|uniref:Uncharacterized protein n=1 Tax=Testicularia cyperi TaxID=1882483 RepID=A0A317XTH9_9BASI|nr:hypothetical protein BCV70DRAFT_199017 [Testicularia cyperi]